MCALRPLALVFASLLFLVGAPVPGLAATPADHHDVDQPQCPALRRSATSATLRTPIPPPSSHYCQCDWRLGPNRLPTGASLGPRFTGYHRLDEFSPRGFLDCYWNFRDHDWRYPDNDGFALDREGDPIKVLTNLRPGQRVDLFGTGTGRFLAPAGTPYERRGLPPTNLDRYDPARPFNYHLYRVNRTIPVNAGPIRPWFGQPGLGLQYVSDVHVDQLVRDGALTALN